MNRTDSGLILLNGGNGNGHASASQRRLLLAEAAANHFKSVIAVLVMQMGGSAMVPPAALLREYQMIVGQDYTTGAIDYNVAPVPLPGDAPPAETSPEPEKEPS